MIHLRAAPLTRRASSEQSSSESRMAMTGELVMTIIGGKTRRWILKTLRRIREMIPGKM